MAILQRASSGTETKATSSIAVPLGSGVISLLTAVQFRRCAACMISNSPAGGSDVPRAWMKGIVIFQAEG